MRLTASTTLAMSSVMWKLSASTAWSRTKPDSFPFTNITTSGPISAMTKKLMWLSTAHRVSSDVGCRGTGGVE
jgi:hypothetical protein